VQLQEIQTSFCNIIKGRIGEEELNDGYLLRIARSHHLQLVQKISLWWRSMQIEQMSLLTDAYLRSINMKQKHVTDFLRAGQYSAFRNEVGLQFLEYLSNAGKDQLTRDLAEFELNLLRHKLGSEVHYSKKWDINPYHLLDHLLNNTCSRPAAFAGGTYLVTIMPEYGNEVFRVEQITG